MDALLVAVLLLLSALGLLDRSIDIGLADASAEGASLWTIPVVGLQILPLLWRRRHPGVVLTVVSAALALRGATHGPATAGDFAVLVAGYSLGAHAAGFTWLYVVPAMAAPLTALLEPAFRAGATPGKVVVFLVQAYVLPWVTGAVVRRRRRRKRGSAAGTAQLAPELPSVATPPAAAPSGDRGRSGVIPAAQAATSPVDHPLTERELHILRLAAKGMPNREIARDLFLSYETVKSSMSKILAKLAVRNRTEAVLVARDRGLITASDLVGDRPDDSPRSASRPGQPGASQRAGGTRADRPGG